MDNLTIYSCRYTPSLARLSEMRAIGRKMQTYLVPVTWWSYEDDRLDARCPAKRSEALVSVKAYDASEARQLVWREWGNSLGVETVGTATIRWQG